MFRKNKATFNLYLLKEDTIPDGVHGIRYEQTSEFSENYSQPFAKVRRLTKPELEIPKLDPAKTPAKTASSTSPTSIYKTDLVTKYGAANDEAKPSNADYLHDKIKQDYT